MTKLGYLLNYLPQARLPTILRREKYNLILQHSWFPKIIAKIECLQNFTK